MRFSEKSCLRMRLSLFHCNWRISDSILKVELRWELESSWRSPSTLRLVSAWFQKLRLEVRSLTQEGEPKDGGD